MPLALLRPLALAVALAWSGPAAFAAAGPAAPDDRPPVRRLPPGPPPTSELLVFLSPGADAAAYAREHGLVHMQTLRSDPDAHVFAAASPDDAARIRGKAGADRRVRAAFPNRRALHVKSEFVPDDPYFHKDTPAAGFPGQWHLVNEHTPGLDARVKGAWARDIAGQGVTIGLVDDCLEKDHPDLSPNYRAADSWDFGQGDADPSPVYTNRPDPYDNDQHGVSTAGVAAARGGNGIGGTGAAPHAGLAGLRVDFLAANNESQFVDATLYRSSGATRTIGVKNHSYGISVPYIETAAEVFALQTSSDAGTIHCWAAGNERGYYGQDANKQNLQSSPSAVTVAALGSDGIYASYSCFGANVFVTAPSSTAGGYGITTTDRTGENGCNATGAAM